MNTGLLLLTAEMILKYPEHADMVFWFHHHPSEDASYCTACIGGWAVYLFHEGEPRDVEDLGRALRKTQFDSFPSHPGTVLEINSVQWNTLFQDIHWPQEWFDKYIDTSPRTKERAQVMHDYIHYWLDHPEIRPNPSGHRLTSCVRGLHDVDVIVGN